MNISHSFASVALTLVAFLAYPTQVGQSGHAAQSDQAKPTRNPRVLIVSAEQAGVFHSGGLGLATADLAKALNEAGMPTDVLMPRYLEMTDTAAKAIESTGHKIEVPLGSDNWRWKETFALEKLNYNGYTTFFLKDQPAGDRTNYFANSFRPEIKEVSYGPAHFINEAFGAFDKAAARFIQMRGNYDIVILNDWHTGLVAPFLQEARMAGQRTPKIITAIHSMAHQGRAPPKMMEILGLNKSFFHPDGLEFYGDVNYLKANLMYSDVAYTVSPTYSSEIALPRFGQGLEGVIQMLRNKFRMTGILNGIDQTKWDPSKQEVPFSIEDLSGKRAGKKLFQERFGFPVNDKIPIISLTNRIDAQKGLDYLIGAMDKMLEKRNVQIMHTNGGGPDHYVKALENLAKKYPDKFKLVTFTPEVEKIAMAYSDFFMNASWFEPSGLNQFFAMRLGTIPIVSKIGGLKDSVKQRVTGFLANIISHDGFHTHNDRTGESVVSTINEAVDTYENDPEKIKAMRLAGMAQDNSWKSRITEFRALFDYTMRGGSARLAEHRPAADVSLTKPSELLRAARQAPALPSLCFKALIQKTLSQ